MNNYLRNVYLFNELELFPLWFAKQVVQPNCAQAYESLGAQLAIHFHADDSKNPLKINRLCFLLDEMPRNEDEQVCLDFVMLAARHYFGVADVCAAVQPTEAGADVLIWAMGERAAAWLDSQACSWVQGAPLSRLASGAEEKRRFWRTWQRLKTHLDASKDA